MSGVVTIHGRDYKTVALRISEFRSAHPDHGIDTVIHTMTTDEVIIKATVYTPDGKILGTGIAHERQGSTTINRTSHVENCETSAIGRALASCGFAGTEYASADEVAGAISQQKIKEATERLQSHNAAVRDHIESVMTIKSGIADGDLSGAAEAWFELDDQTKQALWIAPKVGGIFTTREREVMKTSEFRQSNFGPDDEQQQASASDGEGGRE